MRVLNPEPLTSHGNIAGRRAMLQILEAGMRAADPYYNTLDLLRVANGKLFVGQPQYEPRGAPTSGEEVIDLSTVGRVFVFGAGKGIQHVAKALEEKLGDYLTGGHVIGKHGDDIILEKIGVTLGGHPVPDESCALGCRRILAMCQDLTAEDLVFTCVGNGVSALLTLPVDGVSLEDVRQITHKMQIERGAPTQDLNPIRNHLDQMKGGRISRHIQPAMAIHIIARDPNYQPYATVQGYSQLMRENLWLHTLPDFTTFADAVAMLKKWDAWDSAPTAVRSFLERADPAAETVRAKEFEGWRCRIFGVTPRECGVIPAAKAKAVELGFRPYELTEWLHAEASEAGRVIANIARSIEHRGEPFEPPCALLTSGELLVTVGQENGIGGRNQEYALAAALTIAGSRNIVMAGVDTDGTDGPGGFSAPDAVEIHCLSGGIVDGETLFEAKRAGVDIHDALKRHATSDALWRLKSGIAATQNISLTDLGVTLIMARASDPSESA
jgi:glycerate 2-kinase